MHCHGNTAPDQSGYKYLDGRCQLAKTARFQYTLSNSNRGAGCPDQTLLVPGCSTEGSRDSRPRLPAPRGHLPRTAHPQRPAPLPAYLPEPRSTVPGRPAAVAMRSPRCRSAAVRAGAAAPSPAHNPAPGASPPQPRYCRARSRYPESRHVGKGMHRPPRGTTAPPSAVPIWLPRYPPDSPSPRSAPLTGRCGTGRAAPGREHGRGYEHCPTAAAPLLKGRQHRCTGTGTAGRDSALAQSPAGPETWAPCVPRVCLVFVPCAPRVPPPRIPVPRIPIQPPLSLHSAWCDGGRFQDSASWRQRWGRNSLLTTPRGPASPPPSALRIPLTALLSAHAPFTSQTPPLCAEDKRRALAQSGRRLPGACAGPPAPSAPAATGPGPP